MKLKKTIAAAMTLSGILAPFVGGEQNSSVCASPNPEQVLLLGEVHQPGFQRLVDEESRSMHSLIGRAGGLTADADKESIHVLRPVQGGGHEALSTISGSLLPGDIVFVPRDQSLPPRSPQEPVARSFDEYMPEEGMNAVDVQGAVLAPGVRAFETTQGITLFDAIAMAGWFSQSADRTRIQVVRSRPESTELIIDFQAMLDKGDVSTNVPLLDGDVIIVPTVQEEDPSTSSPTALIREACGPQCWRIWEPVMQLSKRRGPQPQMLKHSHREEENTPNKGLLSTRLSRASEA